ncbi:tetratricopeptide repeat protein [Fulvivirgaceae bacterium BMA12]|uniref:Tetratricopeptide repeat protein n=1 Tax=Agaribacillus aureus TaxID=3051825 RepID=A0ABT8LDZ1_9BACT|nr:tetratricopeptide repeat protein [Fulvivirgaceae bacterium BMA12]
MPDNRFTRTIVLPNDLIPEIPIGKLYGCILAMLLAVGICLSSKAQGQVADSLLTLLKSNPAHDTMRVKLLVNIANSVVWNDAAEAMVYADQALEISRELGWQRGIASSLRQKGVTFYYMSDYLRALDVFQEALVAGETLPEKNLVPSIYNNMASIYAELEQYDKALEYYEAFLKSARETGQKAFEVIALTNIGVLYNDLDQPGKGIDYLDKSLVLAREANLANFVSAILNNLAIAYEAKNDFAEAIGFYHQAVEAAKEAGNKNAQASALNGISKLQLKQNDSAGAEANSLEALKLAREVNSLERQSDVWKTLSNVYELKGAGNRALDAYKRHISLRDSVLSQEKKTEITRKEMQFQMNKNQAVAEVELKRERLIRNVSVLGGMMLLLGSVLAYWMYKKRRDTLAMQQEADFKAKVAETELKVLLSQMNPHFIFNSLNSISDYISKHDTEKANHYLLKFSSLMRMTLESSERKEISLEEDLKLIETYLQIESMRLNHKFTYEIKIDPAIDVSNTLIPPLILQPFIENSIWHGISKKAGNGKISLEIKRDGDFIVYSVEDDGIGRQNAAKENKLHEHSMGTKISQNRISIINKLKGAEGDIRMIDKPEGLRVEVKLPLELVF